MQVDTQTQAQAYEVLSPWGDTILERRRLTQMVGFSVYNLQGAPTARGPSYSATVRLRLDADFGIDGNLPESLGDAETNYARGRGSRYVPGLEQAPLDLMVGYVEGRNLADGWLGFRLGRQYVTDVLGWWSFDGGLVRVTTPLFFQAEVYGGFEQRGGLPLSTSRFEAQGVWRGSHREFGSASGKPEVTDYPSYLFVEPAPAFGVALESDGPNWLHGRFSYRRVYNQGAAITQQFPDPEGGYRVAEGTRISQERLGYAITVTEGNLGAAKGGFSYDLYGDAFNTGYAGLEAYLSRRVTASVDADYFLPSFDGDSIWNWFTHEPITTLTARTDVKFTNRFDGSISGGVRLFSSEGDPDEFGLGECLRAQREADCLGAIAFDPSSSKIPTLRGYTRDEAHRETVHTVDAIVNLSHRYRFGSGEVSVREMLETGRRGHRIGADAALEKRLDGGKYALGARISLYDWADPLRPDRDATSFGYVLGAGFRPAKWTELRLEWEHDINRLVGHRYRVVGLMNVLVLR